MKTEIKEFAEKLKKRYSHIYITGHGNPDADSMLASLLACDLLSHFGVNCEVRLCEPLKDTQPIDTAALLNIDAEHICGSITPDDAVFLVDCHSCDYTDNIVGCIDHHPTKEILPIEFCINERASSAALTVLRIMESCGVPPERKHYLYGIYSAYIDTMSLRSPKTVPGDIPWLERNIEKWGIDKVKLERFGLSLNDQNRSAEELAMIGYKGYNIKGKKISTSYIMYDEISEETKENIINFLSVERMRRGDDLWIYFFCDPLRVLSEVVEIDDDGIRRQTYDRIISRSLDIVPMLEKRF